MDRKRKTDPAGRRVECPSPVTKSSKLGGSFVGDSSKEDGVGVLKVNCRIAKGGARAVSIRNTRRGAGLEYDPGKRNGILGDISNSSGDDFSDNDLLTSPRVCQPKNCYGDVLEAGECYFRSNIATAVKELDEIEFTPTHYTLLSGTPFFLFVKALKEEDFSSLLVMCKKNEEAIRTVMARFDSPRERLLLGGTLVSVDKRDVQLIFGVCDGPTEIPLVGGKIKPPAWLLRCFPSSVHVRGARWALTKKMLVDKLRELAGRDDDTSILDSIRLTHCYVLACVFAPKQNASIPWYITAFVGDVSAMCSYDWSGYIVKVLIGQMKKSTNMHTGGCAIFMLYWLGEHTIDIFPRTASRFPRFLQWNLSELSRIVMRLDLATLNSYQVDGTLLKPNKEEKNVIRVLLDAVAGLCDKIAPGFGKRKTLIARFAATTLCRDNSKGKKPVLVTHDGCVDGSCDDRGTSAECCADSQYNRGTSDEDAFDAEIDGLENVELVMETPLTAEFMDDPVISLEDSEGVDEETSENNCPVGGVVDGLVENKVGDPDVGNPSGLTRDPGVGASKIRSKAPSELQCELVNLREEVHEKMGIIRNLSSELSSIHLERDQDVIKMGVDIGVLRCKVVTLEEEMQEKMLIITNLSSELALVRSTGEQEFAKMAVDIGLLRGVAKELGIKMREVKVEGESMIQKIGGECWKVAEECNRLRTCLSQVTNANRVLTIEVATLEGQKVKAGSSSADRGYVHQLEGKYDEVALKYDKLRGESRTEINMLRAKLILLEKEVAGLHVVVGEKDSIIQNLGAEVATLKERLQGHNSPTFTQIINNPTHMDKIECMEQLMVATTVINDLEREKVLSAKKLAAQRNLINRLAIVPYLNRTTTIFPDSTREVGEPSNPNGGVRKARTKMVVSPGSIAKAIKVRTDANSRKPKKTSPGCRLFAPIQIDDSDDDEKPLSAIYAVPFPQLDRRFSAVLKITPEHLETMKKLWSKGGPRLTVYPGCGHGLAGVDLGQCVNALEHGPISDGFIDAWAEVCMSLLGQTDSGTGRVMPFPARIWGMINSGSNDENLKRWVNDKIERALQCDALLFPMNAPPDLNSSSTHGSHWTLLRYNVKRNEWYFYNSLPEKGKNCKDVHQQQAKKIVSYIEAEMRKVLRVKDPAHALLKDGYQEQEPAIVETCRQAVGSQDCGIVVCNLMELFMRYKYGKRGSYTTIMAGNYRKKMVEWFIDALIGRGFSRK